MKHHFNHVWVAALAVVFTIAGACSSDRDSCAGRVKELHDLDSIAKGASPTSDTTTVNIYVENSASMQPYVKKANGIWKFQMVLGRIESALDTPRWKTNKIFTTGDTIKGNLKDLKQGAYTEKTSKLDDIILSVMASDADVNILVSDFMFSIGSANDTPQNFMDELQSKITKQIRNKLNATPDYSLVVYRFTSEFEGKLFGYCDANQAVIEQPGAERPFFVWVMGKRDKVALACKEFNEALDNSKWEINKDYQVFAQFRQIDLAANIDRKALNGEHTLCDNATETGKICHIRSIDEVLEGERYGFYVDVDMQGLPLDTAYLSDTSHYSIKDEYKKTCQFKIESIERRPQAYRFTIKAVEDAKDFSKDEGHKLVLTLKRQSAFKEEFNDTTGMVENLKDEAGLKKTWGLKQMTDGITGGFKDETAPAYARIEIFIN